MVNHNLSRWPNGPTRHAWMKKKSRSVKKKSKCPKLDWIFFQKVGMAPLHFFRDKLLEKVGGWPLIAGDSWKEEDFTW